MIAPADLATIVGLNLIGAAAPGPDIVLITRTATKSRRHGWATAAGIQTGVLLWCTLTVFGFAAQRLGSVRSAYLRGLATNLSNPKIVIALSAMIAPLLPPAPSAGTALLVIAALCASSLALFAVLVQVLSAERVRRKFLRAGPYVDIGAGVFFVEVGAVLIVRGAAAL